MEYYRRNLVVLSLTTFLISCCWSQVVPFLPLFIKELGVKSGLSFWAGIMMAAPTIAAIVMMPYWGKLADKCSCKLMIIRAGICISLIYLGMSYCWTLCQLLLLHLLTGVLNGFIPASTTLVVTNTPKSKATRYVAVIQSVVAFGTIIGPMIGSILTNCMGYRHAILTASIVVAVAVVLVCLLVDERQKATNNVQPTSLWQDFRLALKKPVLVTALCSDMIYGFVTMASQPILTLYIQELTGVRANLFTGPIFSLPGLAIVLSNFLWCRLGERYTFQTIILFGLIGVGIFTMLQGLVRDIWWFAVIYFLAGLCIAAVSPNTAGIVATKVDTNFQGRAFAIQLSFRNVGCFLAPLLAGSLGCILSFQWVFVVLGLFGLIAAASIRLQMRTYQHSEVTPKPIGL
jgi:DHA1 family multidrug resistance protein-like MFS transporter